MSEIQLKKMARDLIDQANNETIPEQKLGNWLDQYFVGELKRAEMEHAEVDARLYEGLRRVARTDLVPIYLSFQQEINRLQARRQNRSMWKYVLGTVAAFELLEVFLTRSRSLLPQVLIPTAIFYAFIGFLLYSVTQYWDERWIARARDRFATAFQKLEKSISTDTEYDNRRELLQADVLHSEAVEILAHYPEPETFWRDYLKVREADPTNARDLERLKIPAFEKFLKFHVQDAYSAAAREQRFNRLFLEAQEILVSRDRTRYVVAHLKNRSSSIS